MSSLVVGSVWDAVFVVLGLISRVPFSSLFLGEIGGAGKGAGLRTRGGARVRQHTDTLQ